MRTPTGRIVQFRYGEDGVDPAKSDHGKAVNVARLVDQIKLIEEKGKELAMHKWRLGKSIIRVILILWVLGMVVNSISSIVDLRDPGTKFIITKIIPTILTVLEMFFSLKVSKWDFGVFDCLKVFFLTGLLTKLSFYYWSKAPVAIATLPDF